MEFPLGEPTAEEDGWSAGQLAEAQRSKEFPLLRYLETSKADCGGLDAFDRSTTMILQGSQPCVAHARARFTKNDSKNKKRSRNSPALSAMEGLDLPGFGVVNSPQIQLWREQAPAWANQCFGLFERLNNPL